ncbi:MAG: tetratricopeptide repeat protein [Pseudomonadota bacterium]
MVEGDVFREVEEEMRREKAAAVWQKYGVVIIGAAVGIVLGVAGWQAWQAYDARQASAAGSAFEGAVVLAEDGKTKEAREALDKLAEDGPAGYRSLARFRLAGALAADGKVDEAVAAYDALAQADGADASLSAFARIRAAMLRVDAAPFEEINERLEGLTLGSSAWRHTAREVLALSAYRTGKKAEAERIFTEILSDNAASGAMRQRAQALLALIAEPTVTVDAAAPAKSETAAGDGTASANTPAPEGAETPSETTAEPTAPASSN